MIASNRWFNYLAVTGEMYSYHVRHNRLRFLNIRKFKNQGKEILLLLFIKEEREIFFMRV